MQSDTINWSAAILLSLLVHSMMFMSRGAQMGAESAPMLPSPLVTRLSFNNPLDRLVPDKPRPVEKKEPAPELKPVKKIEPEKVLPKPPKKEEIIQQTEPIEKNEAVRQLASAPQVQGQQVSHSTEGLLQYERQQYLHKLLSHIESFKFYPRAARKRYIEGEVRVSFMLRDDGFYEGLVIDSGRGILANAAREAMESAMPLPVPPSNIDISRRIEFTMEYSLAR